MEQIFINALAQEMIKAKEVAKQAIQHVPDTGFPCKMVIVPTLHNATFEDYEELSRISGIRISRWDEKAAFHFVSHQGNAERAGVIAAFNYLVHNTDDYQWELIYMPD